MSIITRCDQCGFEHGNNNRVYGRISSFWQKIVTPSNETLDLCTMECLSQWIKANTEAEKWSEKMSETDITKMSEKEFIAHIFYNLLGGIHASDEEGAREGIVVMIRDLKHAVKAIKEREK